jgi:hypothetical protein
MPAGLPAFTPQKSLRATPSLSKSRERPTEVSARRHGDICIGDFRISGFRDLGIWDFGVQS